MNQDKLRKKLRAFNVEYSIYDEGKFHAITAWVYSDVHGKTYGEVIAEATHYISKDAIGHNSSNDVAGIVIRKLISEMSND